MAQKFYLFARVSTSQLQLLFININNLSAKEDNAVRLGGYNQIKIIVVIVKYAWNLFYIH